MRRPLAPIAAAATGLYIGLSAAPVAAGQASGGDGKSESHETDIDVQVPDSAERVGDYWTPDRMRAAKPTPTPRIVRPPPAPTTGDEDADEE